MTGSQHHVLPNEEQPVRREREREELSRDGARSGAIQYSSGHDEDAAAEGGGEPRECEHRQAMLIAAKRREGHDGECAESDGEPSDATFGTRESRAQGATAAGRRRVHALRCGDGWGRDGGIGHLLASR